MAILDRTMEVFTTLRKWNNLEGAFQICMWAAVQILSLYNNLMHRGLTSIVTNRVLHPLNLLKFRWISARTAEVRGFMILYDSILGLQGQAILL